MRSLQKRYGLLALALAAGVALAGCGAPANSASPAQTLAPVATATPAATTAPAATATPTTAPVDKANAALAQALVQQATQAYNAYWGQQTAPDTGGTLALADLNGDGLPEAFFCWQNTDAQTYSTAVFTARDDNTAAALGSLCATPQLSSTAFGLVPQGGSYVLHMTQTVTPAGSKSKPIVYDSYFAYDGASAKAHLLQKTGDAYAELDAAAGTSLETLTEKQYTQRLSQYCGKEAKALYTTSVYTLDWSDLDGMTKEVQRALRSFGPAK